MGRCLNVRFCTGTGNLCFLLPKVDFLTVSLLLHQICIVLNGF